MNGEPLGRFVDLVTTHSRVTVAVMLLLTVVAGVGATGIEAPPEQDLAGNSTAEQALDSIDARYDTGRSNLTTAGVYVRDRDGNVLSRAALVGTLRYERAARANDSVAGPLVERRGTTSVAGLVSARLAGDPAASYERRIAAVRSASDSELRAAIRETLGPDSEALALMPADYEPGSTTAESTRVVFRFRSDDEAAVTAARRTLDDRAAASTDGGREYFTVGGPATSEFSQRMVADNLGLIGPLALVLIVVTLAFAYRDLADLVVGMTGVLLTLVWTFGLIGWLGVPFGSAGIIAPILLIGLGIDYGIHVFMRYREERAAGGETAVRPAMRRGLGSVAVALLLVTVTTALGFLANLAVFLTVVPALKVEVDGLLERVGVDRELPALGTGGGRVTHFLTVGVRAARVSAVGVLLVAAVAGAGGAYAWTELDRDLGGMPDEPADWKQELPDPVGIERYPLLERYHYVQSSFRGSGPDYSPAQVLVEGSVTDPGTLERVDGATAELTDSEVAYRRADGSVPARTPLTVMQEVAARDEQFAAVYRDADTDGDGVPDRDLERVYDALFDAAPGQAATVIERSDGEYRSLRLVVPMRQSADERAVATAVRDAAATVEADGDALSATATGDDVVRNVRGNRLTRNTLTTLVVSLLAILGLLAAVYRMAEGSATLGAVTVLPVALVVAWVLAGMWLLSVPLTLFTALMLSLAIGLGVDYSIHVSERFAQEFDDTTDVFAALERAVVGTGGALLGSTATTAGAFATLSLATFPALRQMGLMVGLALLLSFVASVVVLPSILTVWARVARRTTTTADTTTAPATD